MKMREAINDLENSDKFKDFKEENEDYYLVHAFTMTSEDDGWQIGYYSESSDKMTVFEVNGEITMAPEQDVLKKQEDTVNPLGMDNVELSPEESIKIAMESKKENHPGEKVTKQILILQNLGDGEVYNITLVTSEFNIINYKVSASDGEVLEEKKQSILKLGKPIE